MKANKKYWLYFDEDNKQFWIGVIVGGMFVQQVGNYYTNKKCALKALNKLNKK